MIIRAKVIRVSTPKKFTTIVADPPWPYGGPGPVGTGGRGKDFVRASPSPSSVKQYGSMSIADLCALRISELTTPNAHLYLWTTNSFIVEAHQIARSWGFAPKTIITWVKRKANGKPSMKTGFYYRGATEHCLFCVKGKLRLKGPARPTVLDTTRLPHSVKPSEFYELVEEQSPGPYLELFARRHRPKWNVWGDQILSDVSI